jgi:hypothetical protein
VNFPPQLLSISEIASIAADTEHNIQEFIREDRIPYVVLSDGILIPLGGFQCCMLELYDLAETLRQIQEGFGPDAEED